MTKQPIERKAFVLLSGGIDSTTALYKAVCDFAPDPMCLRYAMEGEIPCTWVEALSINYGQRHLKELEAAKQICGNLGIFHKVIPIGNLLGESALTNPQRSLPKVPYSQIKGVSPSYVPFRNGTLLSIATAYAVNWVNQQYPHTHSSPPRNVAGVYHGAHAEDAQGDAYPDCTTEFMGGMANAIHVGTYYSTKLYTPLLSLNKAEVVTLGQRLGAPFELTWSCYQGGHLHCGECSTCRARSAAFITACVVDRTEYLVEPAKVA
jgi:7-cyano-7-deazaguanine synthase